MKNGEKGGETGKGGEKHKKTPTTLSVRVQVNNAPVLLAFPPACSSSCSCSCSCPKRTGRNNRPFLNTIISLPCDAAQSLPAACYRSRQRPALLRGHQRPVLSACVCAESPHSPPTPPPVPCAQRVEREVARPPTTSTKQTETHTGGKRSSSQSLPLLLHQSDPRPGRSPTAIKQAILVRGPGKEQRCFGELFATSARGSKLQQARGGCAAAAAAAGRRRGLV